MSEPNLILQTLHSAWIEELSQSFPETKLELGLPKRFNAWGILDTSTQHLSSEIQTQSLRGLGVWGFGPEQDEKALNQLIPSAQKRCIEQIKIHHGLDIRIGKILKALPFEPNCTIWFPISAQIKGKRMVFDLGVGF